jgi:hypothetical protein
MDVAFSTKNWNAPINMKPGFAKPFAIVRFTTVIGVTALVR